VVSSLCMGLGLLSAFYHVLVWNMPVGKVRIGQIAAGG
jgi:hypothetical protein